MFLPPAQVATSTRILLADDDAVSRRILAAILQGRGYTVIEAADGRTAWQLASAPDAPKVLLLDWMMPGMSGLEVCSRLRALPGRAYAYVLLMTARNRHADMLDGFAAGADDFLTKPLSSEEILARVQAAERVLAMASAPVGLAEALREAAESPGGDLLVRAGADVGRILFHAGRVAWVHVSSEPGSLHDLLKDLPGVSRDDIAAVLEECFSAGRHFADVLIEWEILDEPELRTRLQRWLSAKLQAMAERRFDLAMFVPQKRSYTSALTFALTDLLPHGLRQAEPPRPPRSVVVDEQADPIVLACLDEMMTLDGARAAALFDSGRATYLGRRGHALDDGLVLTLTRLLYSERPDDAIEDVLVSRGPRLHLLQRATPSRYLFVELERASCDMGDARTRLQAIARRLA